MNNGTLRNVRGDATEPQTTAPNEIALIPHCCNNDGKWGKGFVLALSKKWKKPEYRYKKFCRVEPLPLLGKVCYAKINDHLAIANMIGQDGTVSKDNPIPVKYVALASCMLKVVDYISMIRSKTGNPVVIHCCKFGSDLAGGDFRFILELIREIWLENGISVVVYEYEPDKSKWGEIE